MVFTINILLTGHPSCYRQSHDWAQSSLASYLSGCGSVSQTGGTARCPVQLQPNHHLSEQQTHGLTFSSWSSRFWEWLHNERKSDTKPTSICPLVFSQLLSVSVWRLHNRVTGFMAPIFQINTRVVFFLPQADVSKNLSTTTKKAANSIEILLFVW